METCVICLEDTEEQDMSKYGEQEMCRWCADYFAQEEAMNEDQSGKDDHWP